jgi:peptidoglycan/LPS O-acetylase OafA/YrhL
LFENPDSAAGPCPPSNLEGVAVVRVQDEGVSVAQTKTLRRIALGDSFSPRHNSLNFLRFVLALTVMLSHGVLLGGFADEAFQNTAMSTIALYGFFGISGFLIAGSAYRNNLGRYLWQRFLRIFPAFWVCLVLTAFLFAGIAWVFGGQGTPDCDYACFITHPEGPGLYVYNNFFLWINQSLIAGTPHGIPFAYTWNGPLWTLAYEFLCYLLLGALAIVGLLRKRALVAALTIATWLFELGFSVVANHWLISLNGTIFFAGHITVFVPVFLTGSTIYLYRDRIIDSGLLALVLTGIFIASLWWPLSLPTNRFTGQIQGSALWAFSLVYPLLWLGTHLPLQRFGSQNDYSYGIYIYAWPVQELLVVLGVQRWGGYPVFSIMTVLVTLPFAIASWWLIEKRALGLKQLDFFTLPGLRNLRTTTREA